MASMAGGLRSPALGGGRTMRRPSLCLAAVALALAAGSPCGAESVWQIGQFDNSYREFALADRGYSAYPGAFPNGVVFRVGQDDPAKAFSFILPGPVDAWAGHKQHTVTITFELQAPLAPGYEFVMDIVNAQSAYGQGMEVSINDEKLAWTAEAGGGDAALTDPAKGVERRLDLKFAGELLRPGENRIVIRSVSGSWVLFDALSLSTLPELSPGELVTGLSASGTRLFKRANGRLRQVVVVRVVSGGKSRAGTIDLSSDDGKTWANAAEANIGLGETVAHVLVPPVAQPTEYRLRVTVGPQSKETSVTVNPEKQWKLYIAPSVHTDIGYTDLQPKVFERHAEDLDLAMQFIEQTQGYPEGSRFKWNCEGTWQLRNYEALRSADQFQRVIAHIRRGDIDVGALPLNMLSQLCGREELCRLLLPVARLRREYGIEIKTATTTDNPSYTWAYASLLPEANVPYLAAGLNNTRGPFHSRTDLTTPIWWEGPDGSKVLLWFAAGYAQASQFAVPPEQMRERIEGFLSAFPPDRYPYDMALAYGAFGDNQLINREFCDSVKAWNEQWEYPKLIICRTTEFFEELERRYGDQIPTARGDWGAYWEDGAGSSAKETALSRHAHHMLEAAEKLLALDGLAGGAYPAGQFDEAYWNLMLYDEHTWGAYNSVSDPESQFAKEQWRFKKAYMDNAYAEAEELLGEGGPPPEPRAPGSVAGPEGWAQSGPGWIENEWYRAELDPKTGGIGRLYDKELGRELLDDQSPYRLNQLIYDAGQPPNPIDRQTPADARIDPPRVTRWAAELTSRVSCGKVKTAEQTVWLYPNEKCVDIRNVLDKDMTYDKEAVYYAFPFSVPGGTFRAQLGASVIRPEVDQISGGCRDWYCVQDFVDVSNGEFGVTWASLDAPLVEFCDITTDHWLKQLPLTNQTLFSYIMNNYWFTNYRAGQGGRLEFRYAITSHGGGYDAARASHFGLAAISPANAGLSTCAARGGISVDTGDPRLLLVTMRPSDDRGKRNSLMVRLWNCSGEPVKSRLAVKGREIAEAYSATITEERLVHQNVNDNALMVRAAPQQMVTLELVLRPR
jgi:hypothetical protein